MDSSKLTEALIQRQDAEGGWAYGSGVAWTEPTAMAVLALRSQDERGPAFERAIAWLRRRQRSDGGWAPQDAVHISSGVTSLSLLAIGCSGQSHQGYSAGLHWVLTQIRPDFDWEERVSLRLEHIPEPEASISGGCPWFPGTASWAAPTVMTTLLLEQAVRIGYSDENLAKQILRARRFLLSRRCPDGGWNHGGSRYRSQSPASYPEMTGMALLAFPPQTPEIASAVRLATEVMSHPGSCEAQAWLTMGLAYQGQRPAIGQWLPCRTTRDLALQILAKSVRGNAFLGLA